MVKQAGPQKAPIKKTSGKQSTSGGVKGRPKKETLPVSTNWADLQTCHVCNSAIDDESKALECESCGKKWACTGCLEISDDLYNLLPGTPLHWYCDTCEAKAQNRGLTDRDDKIMEMMENLLERIKNIESKLGENGGPDVTKAMKNSMEKLESSLGEKIGSGLASYAEKVSQNLPQGGAASGEVKPMKEIIKEAMAQQAEDEREIERRSNNVIIYRVPESASNDRSVSENEDRQFLKDLMEGPLELTYSGEVVKQVTRLGKRTEENGVRPLLVKLSRESDKTELMSSLKKLKNATEKFKRISVAHDLTARQREAVKEVLKAAKREQEAGEGGMGGDTSGNWVLRVVDQQRVPRVVRMRVG